MIEGRKICKRFGDNVLFEGFDFHIDDGEFVCFSGVSGKGKTTLLNIIGLIEKIDEGELLINGKTISKNKDVLAYFQREVGFLFQNFALIENKTVRENLELIRKKDRTDFTIEEVLKEVKLENKIDCKVFTLSGGEQQRVALARLFLKKCNIILADEPTGSLDMKNADLVMSLLNDLNGQRKTIILVTHDERIKAMAHRVIEI